MIHFGSSGALLVLLLAPPSLRAQATDTTKSVPAAPSVAVPDTAGPHRPVSPMGAFWRSFLVPGWGQAKLNRKLTGGLFVMWEGVTLGMTLKTNHELGYLQRAGSGKVNAKRQERQDWMTLLVFNHLLAGMEAYVSAHLWDFPGDLHLQALPGGLGAAATVPIRIP